MQESALTFFEVATCRKRRTTGSTSTCAIVNTGAGATARTASSGTDRAPYARIVYEGIQLLPIGDRAVRLCRARTSGVNRCTKSKRDVSRLITAKLGEIGSRELTMEESIQLSVFGCVLAIRDLKTVRLYTKKGMHA